MMKISVGDSVIGDGLRKFLCDVGRLDVAVLKSPVYFQSIVFVLFFTILISSSFASTC